MSHLYWQCQKHKHFSFSNVRFRRGSIVKPVCVIMVVAVSLQYQQSDNFWKIQKENTKWTWVVIFVWCFIVLLSSGAPCICVCATLPWGQEWHVHCRVTGCWVCSSGPLSPASSLSEALDKTELLYSWQLAVWRYSSGCDTPGTLSEPPSTELMSPDTRASSLSVSTIRYFAGLQQPCLLHGRLMPPLTWTVKWLLGRITSCLCNTGCKLSQNSEKWNTILSISKGGSSKKRLADKVLLIAVRHNIIAVTLVLHRYSLQTKQLVRHKPEERKQEIWDLHHCHYILTCCRYKQPPIKMDNGGFLSRSKSVGAWSWKNLVWC